MAESNDTLDPCSPQDKYPHTRYNTVLETVMATSTKAHCVGLTYVPVKLERCIVLRGRWLREVGFTIGDRVTVTVNSNAVCITPGRATEIT